MRLCRLKKNAADDMFHLSEARRKIVGCSWFSIAGGQRFVIMAFIAFSASCSDSSFSGSGAKGTIEVTGSVQTLPVRMEAKEPMQNKTDRITRTACGAGRWFPGNGRQLKAMVDTFIHDAGVPGIKGRIVGAMAPHAGYQYSGKVAGHTFKAVRLNAEAGRGPDTVVVLGFSHRAGFQGVALMDGDCFVTPMGEVELDVEAANFLVRASNRVKADYSLHGYEHSAENEIPFIQAALPGTKIVVGLFGDHDGQTLAEFVSALSEQVT